MTLNNIRIALTGEQINIRIKDGKIVQILPGHFHDKTEQFDLDFDGGIIFPGLINSHDHLDFNLFPALGNNTYKNYTEWGGYLHKNYKDEIGRVLKVPEVLREQWGIYKNLLCGVTTVINHGKKIKSKTKLLSVYQDCQCIHSVQFEKKWRFALNNPFKKNLPVVIHSGEGTDPSSVKEIDRLTRWNLQKRALIAVHGVAMTESQVNTFKALVWCPESNYFLLGKTAAVSSLKKHIPILFGTDSTLTGSWNIWEHIRLARKTKFMADEELYDTLTINAANTWKLNSGEIAKGKDADLVIAKARPDMPGSDAFFALDPKDILMVIHKGDISLFDEELYTQLKAINLEHYSKVYIGSTCKFVKGKLPQLMQKIAQYYPEVNFPVI
ncbi:MAG: amidohydrolase family protein [Mucilaginibacter sp.]|nr:amidohydrolase family protein [Mucilaginibacter sp.]